MWKLAALPLLKLVDWTCMMMRSLHSQYVSCMLVLISEHFLQHALMFSPCKFFCIYDIFPMLCDVDAKKMLKSTSVFELQWKYMAWKIYWCCPCSYTSSSLCGLLVFSSRGLLVWSLENDTYGDWRGAQEVSCKFAVSHVKKSFVQFMPEPEF